jgi:hypothetical protein
MMPPPDDRSASNSDTLSPGIRRIADLILWGAAVGFAIGLAYFIIVPASRTARVSSFVFWYVLPSLVVLVAVWALRSSAERRVATALLLFAAIASAFAAEALLRAVPSRVAGLSITVAEADSACTGFRNQAACLAAFAMGRPFDRRTTLEVIQDYEDRGIEAWPTINAPHFSDPNNAIEIDGTAVVPLSGIPGVFTVFCNESGSWVTYEADEYGFNNPPDSHLPGEIDVAIVGDSFAHGWCVPFEQTLVGRMRELDSTVLGVGLEGTGPLAQLGIEVEYLAPLRPAVVVWLFFAGNDLRDLSREMSQGLLARYLEPGFRQGLRALRGPLERALREQLLRLRSEEATRAELARKQRVSARQRRRSLAGWIRLTEFRSRLARLGRSRQPEQPYDPALFDQLASRMRDDVASWGGTLLFAYLPSRRRFEDTTTANPHRASILAQVGALGIPTVDFFEILSRHPDPLSLFPFRLQSHLTAEGYELMARTLNESIRALEQDLAGNQTQAVKAE